MPVDIDGQEYLSASEVADRVNVSRQTLWRWRQDDLVPQGHRYRGRQVVFSPEEIQAIADYAYRMEPIAPVLSSQLRLFDSTPTGSGGWAGEP